MGEKNNQPQQNINELLKVRRDKLAELQANGKDPFQIMKYDVTHHSMEIKNNFDELEGKIVSIAGRMMSKRVMGKASFCHIQDLQGTIQSYVARDSVGEDEYKLFKKMDIVHSFPKAFRYSPKNITVLPIRMPVTVRDISTLS